MKVALLAATIALTVSACCRQLPDLPQAEFSSAGERASGVQDGKKPRKAMSLEEAVDELRTFHKKVVGEAAEGLCVEEVTAAFEVMTVRSKGGSVKLALMPLSFGRGRQRAATVGSTVTVTYKNPECPPVEVEGSEIAGAGVLEETRDEAG